MTRSRKRWCRSRSQPIVIIQKEGDIKKPPAVAFTCPAFAWKFRANFSAINRTAASDLETPPTCILPTTNYQAATCLPLPTPTYLEASTILARKPVAAHLHGGLIKTVCGWVDGWLAWLGVFVRSLVFFVRWWFWPSAIRPRFPWQISLFRVHIIHTRLPYLWEKFVAHLPAPI